MVVYIGLLGILIWKFILVEMKEDICRLKIETGNIDKRLTRLEGNLDIIRINLEKILQCANFNLFNQH
ncbi:MAG: hypothetical protein ACOYT4_03885 [Nanoarchaeota archaeon]